MVTNRSGDCFFMAARSAGGVSPVRTATRRPGSGIAETGCLLADLRERHVQVLVHVDGQGTQGRDVEDLGRPGGPGAGRGGPVGGVDGDQETGQRLARTGGRGDQDVLAVGDVGPGRGLGWGRPVGEAPGEPAGHGRVEQRLGRGLRTSSYSTRML